MRWGTFAYGTVMAGPVPAIYVAVRGALRIVVSF